MEPQPGSPTSPPFSPTGAPDEPKEEANEIDPGRKSTSSSSSSSSASSADDIPCHIDVVDVELVNPLAAVLPEDDHGAEAKTVRSATPEDERAAPAPVHGEPADCAMTEGVQQAGPAVHSAEAKPDDWATWPEPPPPAVDDSFASSDGGGPLTEAPVWPANLGAAGAGAGGSDPGRIPASVFQHRTSVSQAEWSMASNESLFSIQGAGDLYPGGGSRSHFDFFYDEAMAEADSKLPSLAEGAEPGDTPESKEFAAPAGAGRGDDATRAAAAAAAFRRHESGSGSSSSNFSFAFPILAETSPRKKDLVSSALYQPLEKEGQQPQPQPQQQQPLEPPVSAFMEMMTEEERRKSDAGCCCCGCCWFDYSWCCRCPWWRCGCCICSCPSFCRCGGWCT